MKDNKFALTLWKGRTKKQYSSRANLSNPAKAPWENGDLIVHHLKQLGIDYVFGIPGGPIEPFFNALARSTRAGGPQVVVSCHEAGAAYMADGYARESGKIGVCCATTGPGATNLLTGVASAYANDIPMLVITAQTSLPSQGRRPLQESSCVGINTLAMFEHCTRYNTLVSHPDQLETKLFSALRVAISPSPGPVHLSIPADIMANKAEKPLYDMSKLLLPYQEFISDAVNTHELCKLIDKNERNGIILLGQNAEKGINEALAFAMQMKWPVICTPKAKGLVSSSFPLYRGILGVAGHQSAINTLTDETRGVVLAVGVVFDEGSTNIRDYHDALKDRLVHITHNPEHLSLSPMAHMHLFCSPKQLFKELLSFYERPLRYASFDNESVDYAKQSFELAKFRTRVNKKGLIKPDMLFEFISKLCCSNTRVFMDSGNSFFWGIHYWQCRRTGNEEKNYCRYDFDFSPMGWAIGNVIGAAIATENQDKPMICFTGDGSVLMNGQEITVAQKLKLNIIYIILNDGAYGTVKHGQKMSGSENFAYQLPSVNFAKMYRALGVRSYRIESVDDLLNEDILELLIGRSKGKIPTVLDVVVDPDAVPPIEMRVKSLTRD